MSKKKSFIGRKSPKLKLKKGTVNSLSAVMLISISALVWLSFIHQGLLLTKINDFLLAQIGFLPALFFPIPVIAGALMVSKIKSPVAESHVFVGNLIVFCFLTAISQGGEIGLWAWAGTSALLSDIGAALFLAVGIGVGLIVSFNVPFEDVLNFFVRIFSAIFSLFSRSPQSAPALSKAIKVSGMTGSASPASAPAVKAPANPIIKNPPPTKADPSSSLPIRSPLPQAATDTVWHYPPLSLLSDNISGKADRGNVNQNANTIESTLEAFGITAKVVEVNLGPAVTQYALEVAIGTKLSKISALSNDLALALAAPTGQIRIEAPIPGRSLVGIELPNRSPEFVPLRKVLDSDAMKKHKSKLAVAMGLDVSGAPVVADIARMPHVLIAGATGTGKSVCINSFLGSLLFRTSPQELNLIMVDPKRVELTGYNGIPHLLSPVIVEPDKVLSALKWATVEMDRRYKLFAEVGVRNLESYNEMSGFQALPYIVILIDELADIMLFAPVEVEDAITRLAQMARATGIHLVIATQRPSVDIITGLIKANIPTRIAFAVSSMIDSRVIMDSPGAEKLLGKGDMLYIPPDQAKPTRIQGAFISDKETHQLIDFLKKQGVQPHYTEEVTTQQVSVRGKGSKVISINNSDGAGEHDPLFEEAFRLIIQNDNASASFLQRKMSVGYARAARILDELQQAGIIGPADGAKPREILVRELPTAPAAE